MEVPGFTLLLQDFCRHCPGFKAEVETLDYNPLGEAPKAHHNIRCANEKCCVRIAENISSQVTT